MAVWQTCVDYVSRVALKKEKDNWINDDIIISPHSLVYTGTHIISAEEIKE